MDILKLKLVAFFTSAASKTYHSPDSWYNCISSIYFSIRMIFIIIQIANNTSVNSPFIKMPVYQGADCTTYKSGHFLKCQYLYKLEPMNTPVKEPIMIFNNRLIFFFTVKLPQNYILYHTILGCLFQGVENSRMCFYTF